MSIPQILSQCSNFHKQIKSLFESSPICTSSHPPPPTQNPIPRPFLLPIQSSHHFDQKREFCVSMAISDHSTLTSARTAHLGQDKSVGRHVLWFFHYQNSKSSENRRHRVRKMEEHMEQEKIKTNKKVG